ncbi:MAG TPA: hypothetical protein VLG38_00110, partial [Gammaproteobacteria bacterium]|nr:hypothetical protein [Gammaproteobacteria bacterium]
MSSIVQSSSYDPFILLEKRMQRLINEGNFDAAVSECGMYIKTLENFKSTFVAAGLIETARTANTGAAVVGLSPAVVQQALLLSQGIASEHENRPGPTLSFDSMAKLGVVGAQAIATATSMAVCAGMWCLNSRVNPDAPTDFSELYSQLQTTALTAGVASAATFSAAALDVLIQRVIKLSNKIHKERA